MRDLHFAFGSQPFPAPLSLCPQVFPQCPLCFSFSANNAKSPKIVFFCIFPAATIGSTFLTLPQVYPTSARAD